MARTTRSTDASSPSPSRSPPAHLDRGLGGHHPQARRDARRQLDPGSDADLKRLLDGKKRFLENRRRAGRSEAITEWPLTRDLIIADTDRKARELAEQHIMIAYRREYAGGWRHPFIDASVATDLDGLMKDRFIVGGPDQCIRAIRRFVEEYGMTPSSAAPSSRPAHAHIMRELELLAQEVMPAFS